MLASIFAALWGVLADVFIGLLDRGDFVGDDIDPVLDTLDPVRDEDLLDRFGGLLDEEATQ